MNYSNILQPLLKKFMPFAQKRMGFSDPPRLFLKNNSDNAANPLGRTAHYDPNNKSITVYVTNRHPKDIMRSISHELVHHTQNCRGEFDKVGAMGDGYAQNDEHLREMEREAYEVGNLCFRDWEDSIKNTTYFEHLQKGDNKKMSTKDWKNKEIKSLLAESWGFKMDLTKLNESVEEEVNEEEKVEEGAFDANHYCIHHGGVNHNGKVEMAEAVQHVTPDENGHISHYDMKLSDGTILENVAAEDIQVTSASLAEEHGKPGNRDAHKAMKAKPDDEELDEGGAAHKDDPRNRRRDDARVRPLEEEEDEKELDEELENPDKADLDKDGKLSGYEKKRGKAIEKSMKKENEELKEAIADILRKHF
jgi:hypothetical protein